MSIEDVIGDALIDDTVSQIMQEEYRAVQNLGYFEAVDETCRFGISVRRRFPEDVPWRAREILLELRIIFPQEIID